MKKFIISVAVCCMAGFMSSCDWETEKCWEIRVTDKDTHADAVAFFWGTKDELQVEISELKKASKDEGIGVSVKYKAVKLTNSECHDANY